MDLGDPSRIVPVILSGGSGTRLWPLSRAARPKQMHALFNGASLVEETAARVASPALFAAPLVVAAAAQEEDVAALLPQAAALILEPVARNTAAAIALAALSVSPADLILVLPSDHLVADPAGFEAAVRRALPFAEQGWIVTFGMTPDRPETGYGYIRRGRPLGDGIWAAAEFVEKPDAARARAFLAGGEHDWNGGIFLMRADAILAELAAQAPEVLSAVRDSLAAAPAHAHRVKPQAEAFARAPSLSIDHAVMEKAKKVAVVPVAIGWSDVGSWEALHEASGKDADGNALAGEVLAVGARDCLVRSDGPLVALVGVEDLVVVASGDIVLVCPRRESQRVRELVDRLKAEGRTEWL